MLHTKCYYGSTIITVYVLTFIITCLSLLSITAQRVAYSIPDIVVNLFCAHLASLIHGPLTCPDNFLYIVSYFFLLKRTSHLRDGPNPLPFLELPMFLAQNLCVFTILPYTLPSGNLNTSTTQNKSLFNNNYIKSHISLSLHWGWPVYRADRPGLTTKQSDPLSQ